MGASPSASTYVSAGASPSTGPKAAAAAARSAKNKRSSADSDDEFFAEKKLRLSRRVAARAEEKRLLLLESRKEPTLSCAVPEAENSCHYVDAANKCDEAECEVSKPALNSADFNHSLYIQNALLAWRTAAAQASVLLLNKSEEADVTAALALTTFRRTLDIINN